MDSRNRNQGRARSLPIIKPKVGVSPGHGGGVTLGRIFLSAKVCTSCVQPLGLFLSRGSNCPKCGLRVCKKCKVYVDNLPTWMCLVCSKEVPNAGSKSMTIGGKGLKYNSSSANSYSNIKRSWSISAAPPTNRGSPVLKAYTKYNSDDRGYNSLPRMPTAETPFSEESDRHESSSGRKLRFYGGGQSPTHSPLLNSSRTSRDVFGVGRRPFEFEFPSSNNYQLQSHHHQSTLYPYLSSEGHGSPASSINFIEDEYWDYYDYEVNRSADERSSCERSLGDTVEYKYQHFQEESYRIQGQGHAKALIHGNFQEDKQSLTPPKKPARTKKGRSRSVGSYDTKIYMFNVVNATPIAETIAAYPVVQSGSASPSSAHIRSSNPMYYSSLPLKKRRSNSFGKENVAVERSLTFVTSPESTRFTSTSSSSPVIGPPERPIRHKLLKEQFTSNSLPRRSDSIGSSITTKPLPSTNTYNTLPKEWKIVQRKDNNSTTIVISGVNSPPNPSSSVIPIQVTPPSFSNSSANFKPESRESSPAQNFSRTYISDSCSVRSSSPIGPPKTFHHAHRKFPIKEVYPSFPSKIQPFKDHHQQHPRELRPLLPLYQGGDRRRGLFALPAPISISPSLLEQQRSKQASPTPNPELDHQILLSQGLSTTKDITGDEDPLLMTPREVIISIQREENNRPPEDQISPASASLTPTSALSTSTSHQNQNQTEFQQSSTGITNSSNVNKPKFARDDSSVDTIKLTMDSINSTVNQNRQKTRSWKAVPIEPTISEVPKSVSIETKSKSDNLWTSSDLVTASEGSSSSDSEDLESDSSFQSVVDNNGLRGGRGEGVGEKDMDELLFQSCLESAGEEDNDEELEQIRRLLRVDSNQQQQKQKQVEESSGKKEPVCKNWQFGDLVQKQGENEGVSDHEGAEVGGEKTNLGQNEDTMSEERTSESGRQNKVFNEQQVTGTTDVPEMSQELAWTHGQSQKNQESRSQSHKNQESVRNQGQNVDLWSQGKKNQESWNHADQSQSQESRSQSQGQKSQESWSQNRKYKSRVHIGLDEQSKTVEVKGDSEVEIVIGQGTYLGKPDDLDLDDPDTNLSLSQSPNLISSSTYPCRESPEGEESGSEESRVGQDELKLGPSSSVSGSDKVVEAPSRSEPDGADAEKSSDDSDEDEDGTTTPILEMNTEDDEDEAKSESTDSWTEEVTFTDMDSDLPAPLDMTLHTICEESETESEYRKVTPVNPSSHDHSSANHGQGGLEKYFNFATNDDSSKNQNLHFDFQNYEESEFSDTFSESSFSSGLRQSSITDLHTGQGQLDIEDGEAVDLASGRLEKYFMNLGVGLNHDSDSVGSESETGGNVLENKKKVLKHHHRRSAEYEDEHFQISEDEDCAFEQEGFDTIKKQRKLRKSQEDLLSNSHVTSPGQGQGHSSARKSSSDTIPEEGQSSTETTVQVPATSKVSFVPSGGNSSSVSASALEHKPAPEISAEPPSPSKLKRVNVSRSNSFTWSSDEEVNLMMRSLRQLVKNMTLSKKSHDLEGKGDLVYLENELIRLMKTETVKTMVDTISMSSDSESQDDTVLKILGDKGDTEPELLSKVMSHIGERLSTWMKDEDEQGQVGGQSGGTIKTAQSVSSDLNDDLESDTRFSWKGSFESTLAKRQSVGSSDSLDYCAPPTEGQEAFSDRSILRSSSLHHLAHAQPILEESESLTSSLSRLNPVTSSGSSASDSSGHSVGHQVITKSKSLFLDPAAREVKSARYRAPGYFESAHTLSSDVHSSTPVLSQRRQERVKMTSESKEAGNRIKVRGLMEFAMQFNYKLVTFEVTIKQCRDLAAVDSKKGRSDPYVKGYLLPDRSKSNKRKTKTKKNTLNPVFGETLKFPISLEDLESRTLWLSVWHSDMFGKNEFMGQVTLPLRGLTFDDPNFTWYPLRDEKSPTNESSQPESPPLDLIVALKWTPRNFSRDRGNLSVLFKEAKGLKLIKNALPSTFIKCCPLTERSKKQKTSLAKRTTNPVWNATMTFENVGREGLDVTLYSSDRLNHEPIANLKLNCDFDLWRNMERREGFWVEGIVQLTPIY